jgi:hypothetical protein
LQPALKNRRLVLRKVNQTIYKGRKEIGINFDKNFAGMNKAATFALPFKNWVAKKAKVL